MNDDDSFKDFERRVERGKWYGSLLLMLGIGSLIALRLGWPGLCIVFMVVGSIVFFAWLGSPSFYNPSTLTDGL